MRLPENRFAISIWIEASKSDSRNDFSVDCSILKARSALNSHLQGQWLFEAEGFAGGLPTQPRTCDSAGTDRHVYQCERHWRNVLLNPSGRRLRSTAKIRTNNASHMPALDRNAIPVRI